MGLVITVDKLSKRYRIGEPRANYSTLREALTSRARAPLKLLSRNGNRSRDSIWALKDVSFEVAQGEFVGIIGRNGAGKSTLLKVLSRITKPTAGHVKLHGRVGSLLEVGTGFHPELTGRENIFLNGAILGMKRTEITRKFDEIVAFAEVEKFIDTQVKHYSSGMYVRLAFAVAAHLEPEILILDEVLAVGDADFQNKCFNKMKDIRDDGSTVIFVSHGMDAITKLCQRAILFSDGVIAMEGPAEEVAKTYLGERLKLSPERLWNNLDQAPGNDIARLLAVRVRDEDGQVSCLLDIRKPIGLEMEFEVLRPDHVLRPNFHFFNEQRACIFVSSDDCARARHPRSPGLYTSTAWIPGNFLSDGIVLVDAALSTPDPIVVHFYEPEVVVFGVLDSLEDNPTRGDFKGPMPGAIRPNLPWTSQFQPRAESEGCLTAEGSPQESGVAPRSAESN